MIIKMFVVWIALIPLIVWNNHYEVPKVFIFLLGSIFVLLSIIFKTITTKRLDFKTRDGWFLTWLFILFVSSLFGEDFRTSFLGGSYRHQGIMFFFSLWMLMKFVEGLKEKNKKLLYKAIAITVIVESLIVIVGRKIGTIGEINAVSGFLAIGSYFVFKSFEKLLIAFPILGILLNFSKSAILSFVPYILNKSKIGILIVVLGITTVFAIKPINNTSIFENREVIWKHATSLILERPVLGFGAESNEVIFKRKFYESSFPLSNLIIDRSHNLFLDVTLWSGIVGLVCFGMFLKESFITLDSIRKKALMAFLIFSMFQPLSVAHWILFALIV